MTATGKEARVLRAGDRQLAYTLERKAVKCINLRITREGGVQVSAPARVAIAVIERFLLGKWEWIVAAQARVAARERTPLSLQDGATLPIEGISHTVMGVKSAKQGAIRRDGMLMLQLRDPSDTAERCRVFERFWRAEAARVLTARVQALYPLFADHVQEMPVLTFRQMKSRWGSCTAAKGRITLNTNLLFVPSALCDYVILHELCHFGHQDHSAAFYRHLSHFCPDHAAARQALRRFPIPQI